MSHGLGSMQRLLLQTVTTMLAEPTMGLFRQPRAACDHQQAPWYLTGPDAYTGTCLCRVVRRDELLGRVLYVRRQAGETVTEAVHQASAGRRRLRLVRAGHLCQGWSALPYSHVRCGLWAPGLPPAPPPPLRPHGGCPALPEYIQILREGCECLRVMTFSGPAEKLVTLRVKAGPAPLSTNLASPPNWTLLLYRVVGQSRGRVSA